MAEIVTRTPAARSWLSGVTLLRIAIVVFVLAAWQLMAVSGLFYRGVVPSVPEIGAALIKLLSTSAFYWNLGVTAQEIAIGVAIGGLSGVVAGLVIGGNRFIAQAFEPYLYYLSPTPKIVFFPVMIMWFGVGGGSKIAMGAVSCFFPIALSVAAGMR
ncbi:MAG TPA: hypothetical protein VNZ48_21465, partial [Xanthobacteraceae bacterium]|nr:hypothetical protein [Xanthobacteraceae bacterium]